MRYNRRKKRVEYLVEWEGWDPRDATWEALESLLVDNTGEPVDALAEFRRRYAAKEQEANKEALHSSKERGEAEASCPAKRGCRS